MGVKKIFVFVIFVAGFLNVYSQNSDTQQLFFKVDDVKYDVGTNKLKLKISVKNNSLKDMHILRPEPFLFMGHNSIKDEIGKHGLEMPPYKLNIEGGKMCKSESPENFIQMEYGLQSRLLKYLVTIPAGESLQFDEIQIDYMQGAFCEKSDYKIGISYMPDLYIYSENEVKETMELYKGIINKSKKLDRYLGYEAKEFHTVKQYNFNNFKRFIDKTLPELKEINGVEYTSTTTQATEMK